MSTLGSVGGTGPAVRDPPGPETGLILRGDKQTPQEGGATEAETAETEALYQHGSAQFPHPREDQWELISSGKLGRL